MPLDIFSFGKKKEVKKGEPAKPDDGALELVNLISPSGIKVEPNNIQIGSKYARTIFTMKYPSFLDSGWLAPIITLDQELSVGLFIHNTETGTVLKGLTKKTAEVQSQISLQTEKGKVRDPQLELALENIEELRDKLQEGTEKLFKFGLYITIFADNLKQLDETENQIRSLLENRMVFAKPATFQQEQGFISTLPLGSDKLLTHASFSTASTSSAIPFISSDLSDNKGVLYGVNRHNNSLILFDRFSMENANTVVFAKAGGGKSYAVKLEVLRSLMQGTDVVIIDPEKEYKHLAETVDGSFIDISLTSPHHLNPFDLPIPKPDENPADVLKNNIVNLLGLVKMMFGGLTPTEESIIDRALSETYAARDITANSDFSKAEFPLMQDFYTILRSMEGAELMMAKLEKFISGSYAGFFNEPTNVELSKKLVVFSIRDMEDELRPLAMYIILRYIWNIIRSETKKRIMVVDEAWWMMQHEDAASFLFGIAKRCRKYYLGLTTITQDVTDFMGSKYGKPIITNSSLQLLLKQSPAAIDVIKETFNLTDQEKFMLLESNVGEGIFFAGNRHVSIQVVASYTEDQIITSDPAQILEIEVAKKELEQAEEKKMEEGKTVEEMKEAEKGGAKTGKKKEAPEATMPKAATPAPETAIPETPAPEMPTPEAAAPAPEATTPEATVQKKTPTPGAAEAKKKLDKIVKPVEEEFDEEGNIY